MTAKLRVCYFGDYDSQYSRNSILIKGLRKNGVEIIECNDRSWFLKKYWRLFLKHWPIRRQYDLLIIGTSGYSVTPLARLISGKPIVLDAFVSFYDLNVFDRKQCSRYSLKGMFYWFLDWQACCLADKILLDSDEHINFFVKTFGIKREKFFRLVVGADDEIYHPLSEATPRDIFVIHFHGSYIPLQGVRYIIGAAKILEKENIIFNLIGHGQTLPEIKELIKKFNILNVNLIPWASQSELVGYMSKSHVCLGMFGDTSKTQRVIVNKIFQGLAVGRPVITADTPAIREFFNEDELLLVKAADSLSLAEGILKIKNDNELTWRLARNGHNKFKKLFTAKALGLELKNLLEKMCGL